MQCHVTLRRRSYFAPCYEPPQYLNLDSHVETRATGLPWRQNQLEFLQPEDIQIGTSSVDQKCEFGRVLSAVSYL